MKNRITALIVLSITAGLIIAGSYSNPAYTKINGAPSGYCGSMAHSATCTGCHSGGPNTVQAGWITSTIPSTGYVPGTTYTITCTPVYAGRTTFGFEATCENSMGTKKGTFIITNTAQTKSISSGVYVTHTSGGITSTIPGSKTWSFNWTAPAAGTGNVTFYGAFLCANGNGNESGDFTYKANLPVIEDLTTGISDNQLANNTNDVSVFPNPIADNFNVSYKATEQGRVEIKLLDLQGRLITPLMSETKAPGEYQNNFKIPFNLNSGIYFLEISTETNNIVKRILVQQ